jgi:hypothetical protein
VNHRHFDDQVVVHAVSRDDPTTLARIMAEVAERLVEAWHENPTKTFRWFKRAAGLLELTEGRAALYWYLRMQTGDLSSLTDSFASIGSGRCRSKQAVQQELERATDDIVRTYPVLASVIHELRRSTKDYNQTNQ